MARIVQFAFACSCVVAFGHPRRLPTSSIDDTDFGIARLKNSLLDGVSYSSRRFSRSGSSAKTRPTTPSHFLDPLRGLLLAANLYASFPARLKTFCPRCATTNTGSRAPATLSSDDFELRRIIRTSTPEVPAEKVVDNLLAALQCNDFPEANAGVKAFWDWTHYLYRASPINGRGNFTVFLERAKYSELAPLIGARTWILEPVSVSDSGRFATQVACVVPADAAQNSVLRRFMFQLRKNERPPCKDGWSVMGMFVSNVEGNFEPPPKW